MPAPKGGEAPWEGGSCGWRPAAGQGQRAGQGCGGGDSPTAARGPPQPSRGQAGLCGGLGATLPPKCHLSTSPWGHRHWDGDNATGRVWGQGPITITITLSPRSLASFRGPPATPVLASHG